MKTIDFEQVIKAVEQVERELIGKKGREKRDLAVRLINAAVDIPWLPEWIEAILFGFMVDLVVHVCNRWWGHRWIEQAGFAGSARI